MSYLCSDCRLKIYEQKQKALKEIRKRLDEGENIIDMYVQYENEKFRRHEELKETDERELFLSEAINWCLLKIAASKISDSGWKLNYSGYYVKK